jgi:hypothetical protein
MDNDESETEKSTGNFRIDPRMLDHFSVAMYKNALKAISELVANCYDADATQVEIRLPSDWKATGAKVSIEDNGGGMSSDDIHNKFLVLGYNKREDIKVTKLGRKPIGNKGIGKLAGFGLAKSMHYITTKSGKTSEFTIDRTDLDRGVKSLEEFKIEISTRRRGLSNGTMIELAPIHGDINPVSPAELRRYLALEYSKASKFEILVNGIPVKVEDIPGAYFKISEKIEGHGKVEGWYKILDRPTKDPGFSIRVRGRIVKPRTTFSIGPSASRAINYAYIIGDVAVDFLDPDKPGTKLDEFTISTDREGFNEDSPTYMAFENWAIGKLKSIAKTVQEIRSDRLEKKVKKSKSIKSALGKLPGHLREDTEIQTQRFIHDLPWENEKEAYEIIKAFVESRATDEVTLILRKLAEADDKDIKGFAKLLSEYGLADLWRISQYTSSRLEVIKQFDRMILKIGVLETQEIHPMIERNMWLISDDYTMLSSNQTVRTFLYRTLGMEDVPENKRPDFICKSRPRRMVIIELKKGEYKLTAKDFAQLCGYIDILRKYKPDSKIEGVLIGGSCETDTVAAYGNTPIRLMTYCDLLEDAKDRYRELINILKREK